VRFTPTRLPGVILVEPDVHRDERGFFLETYHAEKYRAGGITGTFLQDNHSRSAQGTLRGLHAQLRRPQGKLVRAVEGEMLDVAVDIRRRSPTFGQWVAVRLSGENFHQLYVPPGFAHGFCVLSPVVHVEYKCTDFYDRADEIAVAWDDPEVGIEWPLAEPTLSERDRRAPRLKDLLASLPD
jgi:dTDP-4-dehydrorhamnose 3,5-epimerase